MAVGSGTPYNEYTGNGVTVLFAFGFTLLDADDLVVTVAGVEVSAYTISGLGVPAGGSITFDVAPASGLTVLLRRIIEFERLTDYQTNGDLQAETVNEDFDRLWLALQEVSYTTVNRVVRAPFGEEFNELPAAASRALKYLAFDGDGNVSLAVAPVVADASLPIVNADSYGNLQLAVDAVHALGGGTVAVYADQTLDTCLVARDGVTVWVPGNDTKITIAGSGVQWPLYGCVLLGGYMDFEWARATTYPANAITRGDKTVTTTTAGNASNFAVGEVVAVETTTSFDIGTGDLLPTWCQLNVITSVNGGTGALGLRHSIDDSQASVKIRKLNTAVNMRDAALADTGIPLRAVRDFSIIGGTWIASQDEGPFAGAGGAIDCYIAPHRVIAATSPAYGNLFANCAFKADVVECLRMPVELAFSSHGNTVKFGKVACRDSSQTVLRLVGFNSSARDNSVEITHLNFGSRVAEYGVEIINAYRNRVYIQSLMGASITYAPVQASYFAYTGTNANPVYNDIEINVSGVTSQQRYISLGTSTAGNRIKGRFFGAVSLPASAVSLNGSDDNIIDVETENGTVLLSGGADGNRIIGVLGTDAVADADYPGIGSNVFNYETTAYRALRALDFVLSPTAYTSAAPLTKTVSYGAAAILPGDVYTFKLKGVTTGAGGTKTLQLTFAGTLILDLSGGSAIASGTQGVDVEAEIYVFDNTTAIAFIRRTIGATVTLSDVSVSGKNFTTTAYDFVEAITVASGGDTFTVRTSRLKHQRPFTNNLAFG